MIKYFHSEALDLPGKIDTETGEVTIKEKGPNGRWVRYSANENRIISENDGKITPEIHLFKKIFMGEIVKLDGRTKKE